MTSSSLVTIRRLNNPSDTEVQRVVQVLQSAFGQDNSFTDFLGGDRSLVPANFESNIRAAAIGGEIHVASFGPEIDDIVGAAIWFGPGQASMSTEEQREVGSKRFFALCPDDLKKWWLEEFIPSMEKLANESLGSGFKEAQWALLLLGVVREHHRKGIGKAMMRFVEDKAKSDGVSIVLETTTELNVQIYKRMGFEIKGTVTVTSPKLRKPSPIYEMIKAL